MKPTRKHLILLTAPEAALIVQLLRAARGWAHARKLADRIAATCLRGLRAPVSRAAHRRALS